MRLVGGLQQINYLLVLHLLLILQLLGRLKIADIAVEAEPTVVEKPPNKAVKSVSIFFAIASPNNLPISPATFLGAEFLPRSVKVVIIPCSEQVIVFDVGSIAVLDKSDASDTCCRTYTE